MVTSCIEVALKGSEWANLKCLSSAVWQTRARRGHRLYENAIYEVLNTNEDARYYLLIGSSGVDVADRDFSVRLCLPWRKVVHIETDLSLLAWENDDGTVVATNGFQKIPDIRRIPSNAPSNLRCFAQWLMES